MKRRVVASLAVAALYENHQQEAVAVAYVVGGGVVAAGAGAVAAGAGVVVVAAGAGAGAGVVVVVVAAGAGVVVVVVAAGAGVVEDHRNSFLTDKLNGDRKRLEGGVKGIRNYKILIWSEKLFLSKFVNKIC
jgi:hypothetical protein